MRPAHRDLRQSWYPGYYGVSLSEAAGRALETVADTMIPGDRSYPAATTAGIATFVSEHVSPVERDMLENLLKQLPPGADADDCANWLGAVERNDREGFALLRAYVYLGYYSSALVVAAMNKRGLDYHGPPQPFGYQIDAEQPVPQHARGSYTPTEEVSDVRSA
jgi:hypothetical protein